MTSENSPNATAPDAGENRPATPLKGVEVIREALKTMPLSPGVYRMLGEKGDVLYVGKALALKKRVTSYTQVNRLPERLRRMVSETASMEIVTTHTEAEALLLEANYIKRMKPRYNILLRDDKSYPWLMLTDAHAFPQIAKHRGKPVKGASLWGPFASAWAVNQTLNLLQRVFCCVPALIPCLTAALAPACCIKSNAVPARVWTGLIRPITQSWSSRRGTFCPARITFCGKK